MNQTSGDSKGYITCISEKQVKKGIELIDLGDLRELVEKYPNIEEVGIPLEDGTMQSNDTLITKRGNINKRFTECDIQLSKFAKRDRQNFADEILSEPGHTMCTCVRRLAIWL